MSRAEEKRQMKERQRAIEKLQVEMATEITQVMRDCAAPMDMAEIMANYPMNRRRVESDDKTLKQYVAMGLGYMIDKKMIKELPQDSEGKWKLELIG